VRAGEVLGSSIQRRKGRFGMLFSCSVSYRAKASEPLFRQSLQLDFSHLGQSGWARSPSVPSQREGPSEGGCTPRAFAFVGHDHKRPGRRCCLGATSQSFLKRVSVNMTRIAWCIRTLCTRAPTDWPKEASERKRLSIDATCCQNPPGQGGLLRSRACRARLSVVFRQGVLPNVLNPEVALFFLAWLTGSVHVALGLRLAVSERP
jgi:hypothetical protein